MPPARLKQIYSDNALFVYLPQVLLKWPRLCDFRFRGCLGTRQNLEPDLEINKG